jgi:hypothetical protein
VALVLRLEQRRACRALKAPRTSIDSATSTALMAHILLVAHVFPVQQTAPHVTTMVYVRLVRMVRSSRVALACSRVQLDSMARLMIR